MTCLHFQGRGATKVRVWTDELPDHAMLPQGLEVELHAIVDARAAARTKSVAIEVFRAFGASFHYGLLGGVFEETGSRSFEFVVPVTDPSPEIMVLEPLAGRLDRVLVGGGAEFASAVIGGIAELDRRTLPAGRLTFNCMAHGEIGSAPAVFGSLARATIRMMIRGEGNTSFDDAMNLLAA